MTTVRDLASMLITRRCWRCGRRQRDLVTDMGSHLAGHYSDRPRR